MFEILHTKTIIMSVRIFDSTVACFRIWCIAVVGNDKHGSVFANAHIGIQLSAYSGIFSVIACLRIGTISVCAIIYCRCEISVFNCRFLCAGGILVVSTISLLRHYGFWFCNSIRSISFQSLRTVVFVKKFVTDGAGVSSLHRRKGSALSLSFYTIQITDIVYF